MKESTKIFIILGVIVALAIISVVQSCKVSSLKKEVSTYKHKTEVLNDSLDVVMDENKRLREMMTKANEALEKMVQKAEETKDELDERNDKIDNANPDWLLCPLPDEVRDAFRSYCYSHADIEASDCLTYTMRQAECRKT